MATSLDRNPSKVDFVRDVQPIFRKHCYECHGSGVQESGLRLDLKQHALKGGERGQAIVPGKPKSSRLLQMIVGDDGSLVMPPKDESQPLSALQVETIRTWIRNGAKWPDGVDPVPVKNVALWSFQPVQQPAIPPVANADWVSNPIDAFVLARLEAAGFDPNPPAPPRALARRAAFDLLGLPLDPDVADEVAAKMRSDEFAFDRFVDQLLASPHYGERWARHWLDLVRYADTNGYEIDGTKPMAWKYRDYLIQSLNDDTPYDRFILEQLAGDELPDASPRTVIATGFIRVGPWDAERGASVQPSEVIEERFNELDDMVATTSQVFLGLTLGCARCHDHKFDPLTARDYYSMVSIFSPLERQRAGRTELTRPTVPPTELKEKNLADARIAELREKTKSLTKPLRDGLLADGKSGLPADAVTAFKTPPEKRNDNQKQLVQRFQSALDTKVESSLKSEIAAEFLTEEARQSIELLRREILDLEGRFNYPAGYFFYEPSPVPPPTHLLKRGNPKQPGPVVEPAVPAAIVHQSGQQPPGFESPDAFTSRRRISLARWIASGDNPLTARVIVNRVWQGHFGQGLVRTSSDFGRRGTPPTHPQLLDWLAHWFVHDANWSLKKLHRLIMTSNTWRMSKRLNAEYDAKDPDNRLLWRFPYRRLEAEAIRDAMLSTSGQLNGELFGPSMYPFIPADARRSGYDPTKVWRDFDEKDASRRTVYAFVKRTLIVPFLDTLDFCDTTRSAGQRETTIVAPQALELLNGDFTNRQAAHFAARLIRECGDDIDQQIKRAVRLALARPADKSEMLVLRQHWSAQRAAFLEDNSVSAADADHRALAQVCRVIFNLNEFVYTD